MNADKSNNECQYLTIVQTHRIKHIVPLKHSSWNKHYMFVYFVWEHIRYSMCMEIKEEHGVISSLLWTWLNLGHQIWQRVVTKPSCWPSSFILEGDPDVYPTISTCLQDWWERHPALNVGYFSWTVGRWNLNSPLPFVRQGSQWRDRDTNSSSKPRIVPI